MRRFHSNWLVNFSICGGYRRVCRLPLTGAFILLAACTNEAEEAEQRYSIVLKSGDAAGICNEGKAVVASYLKAGNSKKYEERRVATDIQCATARQEEESGIYRMPDGTKKQFEPENMF